jgi:glutathione reductase (NADPH)
MCRLMTRTFDLIVIGSGSAAGSVASRCRHAGWTVAMVDKRPFGGTCALRGCDPKKVLVGVAAAVDAVRLLSDKGARPDSLAIDWAALMRFKRSFTEPVPAARKAALTRIGVEAFDGIARFVSPSRITVGNVMLEASRAIVIATGAMPAPLAIEGEEHVIASDEFLELDSLPPSIAFIGGGYVSLEFAHVAARAGARVTILHRGVRPLEHFDSDLVDRLVGRTEELGIEVRLRTDVTRVEAAGDVRRVHARAERGPSMLEVDLVVHGAGRVPDIEELNLEAAGVQYSDDGVTVNEHLQSVSHAMVYAAGDCADTDAPPLTPVAGYEGRIVAANLLEGNRTTPDYAAVPSVVFTIPPLARVGLGEEEARRQGRRFRTRHEDTSSWYSSRRLGERYSGFTLLVEEDTDRILGAHLLAPHADETINLFALAMRTGITATEFKQTLWAYPTHGSDTGSMF